MENEVIIFGLEMDRYVLAYLVLGISTFTFLCSFFYVFGMPLIKDKDKAKLAKDSKGGE